MITTDDGLRLPSRIWLGKNEDMDQNATAKDNLDAEVAALACRKVYTETFLAFYVFSVVLFKTF